MNGFEPLTIFAKSFILDVWQGSEYAPAQALEFIVLDIVEEIYHKIPYDNFSNMFFVLSLWMLPPIT